MFSESQIKVILILLDEKGHAGWELAEHIEVNESNLNPVLRKLERMGVIFEGNIRDSAKPTTKPGTQRDNPKYKRPKTRIGEYKEIPYFLNESLETLRIMIRELKGKKYPQIDAGFVLNIISRSKYIEEMIKKFEEDVYNSAIDELTKNFAFAKDDFYMDWFGDLFPRNLLDYKNRQQTIDSSSAKLMSRFYRPSNIEIWYNNYMMGMSPEADRS